MNSEASPHPDEKNPKVGVGESSRVILLRWMMPAAKRVLGACALAIVAALPARAQTLPSDPIVLADGHVTLGGDVSASFSPEDTGFFNYSDYEHSTLRTVRLALSASVKAGDHVEFLTEIRSENGERPAAYGLYVRIRPWRDRQLDIQVGRVPPTFGAFSRRSYASDNPLISYPLAYQYLTSIRADALPANVDELLRMRARGWLSNYSVGNLTPDRGVPLVSAFRWDTGVQAHTGNDWLDVTAGITGGTLSNPQVTDNNDGAQISGRLAVHPIPGLLVGASAARGTFVDAAALHAAMPEARNNDYMQTAWGGDIEYSRGYYLIRLETVVSQWSLPMVVGTSTALPLSAVGTMIEGRYKFRPGLYGAARFDHLGFSEVQGSSTRESWDAPVTRWEVGGGYSLQRNLLLKLAYQHNSRAAGRVLDLGLASAQLVFWF